MDLNTLGEPDRIPWRMHRCFHNPPYNQVETIDNLLRKHLPCMVACIIPTHPHDAAAIPTPMLQHGYPRDPSS